MHRQHAAITVLTAIVLAVGCSSTDDGVSDAEATLTTVVPTTIARTTIAPTTEESSDTVPATDVPPITPEGFDRVAAVVTKADGETCDVCLWLAESPQQWTQGLMNVTDLGDADGMAFVYPLSPRTGNFWMKDTLLPLSIAFFGLGGGHLGEFDMEPCVTDVCPKYRTARDFVVAVETNQGELAELGIGPGSSLELTDLPCP